jgi:hypothetical protein
MLQCFDEATLLTNLPTVEEALGNHEPLLKTDATGYRNHVYRVANLCLAAARGHPVDLDKLAVAAVFHDLGIWTNHTFDYIAPSVALARAHLAARGLAEWAPEIEAIIVNHHKVTSSQSQPLSLVESFRRADWIDVTCGLRRFGVPRPFIATVRYTWPDAGFHRRLVQLMLDRVWNHPLSPLPMVKW